jgi:AraC-like DNA-binding protein
MEYLNIHTSSIREIIQVLAQHFKTDFEENCNVYRVNIPKTEGSGYVQGINFPDGLGIIHFNSKLKNTLRLKFSNDEMFPLKLFYCLEGHAKIKTAKDNLEQNLNPLQSILLSMEVEDEQMLTIKANERIKLTSLEIDRAKLIEYMQCNETFIESDILRFIFDGEPEQTVLRKRQYSFAMSKTLLAMELNLNSPICRKFFLASQSLRLFTQQILCESDEDSTKIPAETNKIAKKVKQIIDDNISRYSTVAAIQEELKYTNSKLQESFQSVTGMTISQYVREKRLEEIMYYLEMTDIPILEIAKTLGMKSPSYISKIVKSNTGYTPKQYRQLRAKR